MSVDTCTKCDQVFDTDDDPDCYVATNDGYPPPPLIKYVCICESCREGMEADS